MSHPRVQVIVHAGFHKTGTTSLQSFFSQNKSALAPYLAYYGKDDFPAAGTQARLYAQRPFPHRLFKFRRALRAFLQSIPDHATIVLSRETFSGGMPGHRTLSGRLMTSYQGPATRLAKIIISELRRRFGPTTEITFFYTTRERESWLRSVYGHLLRSIRLTEDYESFRARFPELPGPEIEARRLAQRLSPVPVHTAALETYASAPEGPAAALLDLLEIPPALRSRLRPVARQNTANPPELQADFLRLNRSIKAKSALKAAKEALL
ncbi:hypothetical protein [uncultured Lentibacter sp.]|mgnify:CR=1 FL=1|uniref:hypothetical protein n=1 Tax=uncultured Lentibacter sp. TaxID=1659309 RepID=UPI002609039A|nr:hypothetical protein [uncultured Lentibacter sp.]